MSGVATFEGLGSFQLEGVRDTGGTIGDGSYATVKELDFCGMKCAGKRIHNLIYDLASRREKVAIVERFMSECKLLSGLHHPCIVQFLGVYLEESSQLPVLVMEYLYTSLSACIDMYGVLQDEISYSILFDVALGLRYLHEHSPPIIHRDLSANNVLLTRDMAAKISDLGVAKILNLSPAQMGQMTQTQMPGTPSYMPPEAMVARPKYTAKVDIFSYGVMIVHMLSGQWPIPGEAFQEDSNDPDTSVPVSELARRAEYLQKIRPDHPLMRLIRQCLSNTHSRRPNAAEIAASVGSLATQHPPSFEDRFQMLQQIGSLRSEVKALQGEVGSLQKELGALRAQAAYTRDEVETLQAQVDRLSVRDGPMLQGEAADILRLSWITAASLPVEMSSLQSVMKGGKVYVGGGTTYNRGDLYQLFGYDPGTDVWSALPICPVAWFALCAFQDFLVTVGGMKRGHDKTGELYRYNEDSGNWEEYLRPMPTARTLLTAVTTVSAIIACGGVAEPKSKTCSTVEVYTAETDQWHTADPLPVPWALMTTVTTGDTCYLLGGKTNLAFRASLSCLVENAVSPPAVNRPSTKSDDTRSLWKPLPNVPFTLSSAASLGGHLLAVGGSGFNQASADVYVFANESNSWIGLGSRMPACLYAMTVVALAEGRLLVCGGLDAEDKILSSVYVGTCSQ